MFILLILLLLFFLVIVYTFLYGISPMPSSNKAKKVVLNFIPKDQSGKIFELGSGWGNLAFVIASKCDKATVIGFEISPVPWMASKGIAFFWKNTNLILLRRDFFRESLHDADVVVCYLYPGAMTKLKEKFEKELKPGTIVISNTFAVPGWAAEHVVQLDDLYRTNIYFYRVS